MTEWRRVPGFTNYSVSDAGQVRGRGGRILKLHLAKGYLVIGAYVDDKRVKKGVHQLVALAFHGPAPSPTHEVAHWDGCRTNNAASNVRWATGAENREDTKRLGRYKPPTRHGSPRLTPEQVAAIRSRWIPHTPGLAAVLAAEFGVTPKAIGEIAAGRRWKA